MFSINNAQPYHHAVIIVIDKTVGFRIQVNQLIGVGHSFKESD